MGLKSHFNQTETSAHNCLSFLLLCQKSTELNPVLDTMRHKMRGIRAKCADRTQPSGNGHPTGGPAAESCQNRQQKMLWAKSVKKVSSFPKKEAKTAGVVIAVLHASEADGESSHKKAEKRQHGAIRHSQIYPPCIRKNAYSVLLKLNKHASVTDARSSWLERWRALMYSAFIHVAACRATCWTVFPSLSAAARPGQPFCG